MSGYCGSCIIRGAQRDCEINAVGVKNEELMYLLLRRDMRYAHVFRISTPN